MAELYMLNTNLCTARSLDQLIPAALDGILKVLHPDIVYFFRRNGE
jgi:hypothetical protein